ncbi:MAG: DUF58 domain-containing protein, partial [Candidatus Bipolaricaulia bacterium]
MGLLLEEEFLRKLERLRLIVKLRAGGRPGGSHWSPKAGPGLEFTDYKKYYPGDDFRYIDWKAYARLD